MGKLWLGAVLLAGFLLSGFLLGNRIESIQAEISQTLEQAAQQTAEGNLATGQQLLQQAWEAWQTHHEFTAAVADHSPMEEIDGYFAQLEVYAAVEQPALFASGCARLAKLVAAVGEAHSLTWWNLL